MVSLWLCAQSLLYTFTANLTAWEICSKSDSEGYSEKKWHKLEVSRDFPGKDPCESCGVQATDAKLDRHFANDLTLWGSAWAVSWILEVQPVFREP